MAARGEGVEEGRRGASRVRRRTLSYRSAITSSGRRGDIRRSRRKRRKKMVFWALLLGLIGVLAWGLWSARRAGVEPREDVEIELRSWDQRRAPTRR